MAQCLSCRGLETGQGLCDPCCVAVLKGITAILEWRQRSSAKLPRLLNTAFGIRGSSTQQVINSFCLLLYASIPLFILGFAWFCFLLPIWFQVAGRGGLS